MLVSKRHQVKLIAASVALLVSAGCHHNDFCLEIDGPCYNSGQTPLEYYVAGFPMDRVDTTAEAGSSGQPLTLHVGEHVSLYLVHLTGDARGIDTVRSVNWTITNDSVVRVDNGSSGTGILAAVHVGTAGTILANGSAHEPRACTPIFCRRISAVEVVIP